MLIWINAQNQVDRIHYQPETLTDEEKTGGIPVITLPDEPVAQSGTMNRLYYESGTLVWKTESRPLTSEEKLQKVEEEKAALEQKLAQLNGDFVAFTDFYFEKNPTQA